MVRAALLACLILAGCAAHRGLSNRFMERYETARYVAVVPPWVDRWWQEGGQYRPIVGSEETAYRNLVEGLEQELEKLGLVVVWVVPDAETGPCLEAVLRSFSSVLPEVEKPWDGVPWGEPDHHIDRAGLLLDAYGADLLLLVQGSNTSWIEQVWLENQVWSAISLQTAFVGPDGLLLWVATSGRGGNLLDPETTAAAVEKFLEPLPRVRSPRSEFIEDDAAAAARAARQARAREILAAEAAGR
jgi:hypothetical protein